MKIIFCLSCAIMLVALAGCATQAGDHLNAGGVADTYSQGQGHAESGPADYRETLSNPGPF